MKEREIECLEKSYLLDGENGLVIYAIQDAVTSLVKFVYNANQETLKMVLSGDPEITPDSPSWAYWDEHLEEYKDKGFGHLWNRLSGNEQLRLIRAASFKDEFWDNNRRNPRLAEWQLWLRTRGAQE